MKSKKIIFIIPAYNEAQNIEKVISAIKKDFSNASIIVVNDCSKDNTKEIVERNGTVCITMPFNVRYAMAIQTGIKYAYQNNFDYAILIDGDGQHIPSEATKLLSKIKEKNVDIVIGSRFIEKTDYKHPFFRKLGTKLFSAMIKLLCKKKVYDPTSGFQCLNRRVMERFTGIGKYPEFPDANLVIELLYDGYKIEETSVKMKLNDTGQSMHSGIIKPIKYMIKVFYSIIIIFIRNTFKKRSKD